jgi:hypothetical protein
LKKIDILKSGTLAERKYQNPERFIGGITSILKSGTVSERKILKSGMLYSENLNIILLLNTL